MKVTIRVERDEPRVAQEVYTIEPVDDSDPGADWFHVFSSRHGDYVLTGMTMAGAMHGVSELVAETTDPGELLSARERDLADWADDGQD